MSKKEEIKGISETLLEELKKFKNLGSIAEMLVSPEEKMKEKGRRCFNILEKSIEHVGQRRSLEILKKLPLFEELLPLTASGNDKTATDRYT